MPRNCYLHIWRYWTILILTIGLLVPPPAVAQDIGCGPTVRPHCQTIYVMQPVTTYRVEHETVYEEQQVTRYQPVWERQVRQRRYTVARPVTQTIQQEQTYTVVRPVWQTQMRDCSYNVVRNVVEQHEREEQVTVMRQVVQTEMREQRQKVRKYVTQTIERDVPQVSQQPVTTYQTSVVDRGQYVMQTEQKPGFSLSRLHWAPGGWSSDAATGQPRYQRGGLVWVKNPAPTRTVARQVWQPNPVQVQVPQTSYQRVVTTVKVPTQVGRWVEQDVVQRVPVQVVRQVPETQVRRVPYTTTRQVVQRVERQVPVRVCKYVTEQKVRKVPMTYTRMMYEECVEEVPVCVCKMIATQETVRVPRCVQKLVPVTQSQCVPQTVMLQVPCGCGAAPMVAANANCGSGVCPACAATDCGCTAFGDSMMQGGVVYGSDATTMQPQGHVRPSPTGTPGGDGTEQPRLPPGAKTIDPSRTDGWYRAVPEHWGRAT